MTGQGARFTVIPVTSCIHPRRAIHADSAPLGFYTQLSLKRSVSLTAAVSQEVVTAFLEKHQPRFGSAGE
jgi:hypothetical protein